MALKSNWQPGDRLNAANVNVITTTINHATRSAGLILPFYFYPNSPYTDASCLRLLDLIREYHNVPVIVIVNPVSPSSYDLNWEVLIRQLKAAGATVVGYVATGDLTSGWVARSASLVHADIDAWQSTWPNSPIDGIFLDVLPFDPGTANAKSRCISATGPIATNAACRPSSAIPARTWAMLGSTRPLPT
jgi:Spherulation-specific family 4